MKDGNKRINPILLSTLLTLVLLAIGFFLQRKYPNHLQEKELIEAAFNLCIGGATVSFAYGLISTLGAKREISAAVVSLFTGDSNVMGWLSPEARKGAVSAAFSASFGGDRGKTIFDHVVGKYFSSPINFAFNFDYDVALSDAPPVGTDLAVLTSVLGFDASYGQKEYFWATTDFKCGIQIFDPSHRGDTAENLDGYELSVAVCFDSATFEQLNKSITTAERQFVLMREIILDRAKTEIGSRDLDGKDVAAILHNYFQLKIWQLDPKTSRQSASVDYEVTVNEIGERAYLSAKFKVPSGSGRSAAYRIRLSFPQRREHSYFICSMPWPTKNPKIELTGLPGTKVHCIALTSSIDQAMYEIVPTDLPDGRPKLTYRASEWHFPRSAVLFNW